MNEYLHRVPKEHLLPQDRKIITYTDAVTLIREIRGQGLSATFTSGVHDVLHAGHVEFLRGAKKKVTFYLLA